MHFTRKKTVEKDFVGRMSCCWLVVVLAVFATSCRNNVHLEGQSGNTGAVSTFMGLERPPQEPPYALIPVVKDVVVADFFDFIDTLIRRNDTLAYKLSENLLLRANPWILDTLVSTDYYYQQSRGNFVYDQRTMVVLKAGDTLLVPGPKTGAALVEKMVKSSIDINIPAFEMRILEGDSVLFTIPVRVGKNQKKYLKMAKHTVDLRTRTGSGEIFRVNRNPIFFDPVTGEKFDFTKRDDRQITHMPQIPWLECSINGQRYGQMIHPTTNPRTLGKAASNGCVGVSEADAWRVYAYAPVGTPVLIRYDLKKVNELGDTIQYKDIYRIRSGRIAAGMDLGAVLYAQKATGICWCETIF
jgi:L,D-transpeptidase ErfK/SrfK